MQRRLCRRRRAGCLEHRPDRPLPEHVHSRGVVGDALRELVHTGERRRADRTSRERFTPVAKLWLHDVGRRKEVAIFKVGK